MLLDFSFYCFIHEVGWGRGQRTPSGPRIEKERKMHRFKHNQTRFGGGKPEALHIAARRGEVNIVNVLLRTGYDDIDGRDNSVRYDMCALWVTEWEEPNR